MANINYLQPCYQFRLVICFKQEFVVFVNLVVGLVCTASLQHKKQILLNLEFLYTYSFYLCSTERISQVSITASPADQLFEGRAVNLTCEASGSIFTRRWRKDGAELSMGTNMELHEFDKVLSFRSLNTTSEGNYTCAVENPIGLEEASYVLQVQRK